MVQQPVYIVHVVVHNGSNFLSIICCGSCNIRLHRLTLFVNQCFAVHVYSLACITSIKNATLTSTCNALLHLIFRHFKTIQLEKCTFKKLMIQYLTQKETQKLRSSKAGKALNDPKLKLSQKYSSGTKDLPLRLKFLSFLLYKYWFSRYKVTKNRKCTE